MIETTTTTETMQPMATPTVAPVENGPIQPMMQPMDVPQEVKPYTFRRLSSPDVFPMLKIIGTIGVNEFTVCFEKDSLKNLIASMLQEEDDEAKGTVDVTSIVGISVILEIANVICGNLPKCEAYIYQLLSQTSNLSVDEIKALDMVTFLEMIVDFIKKEEFKDFIKVASKLLK